MPVCNYVKPVIAGLPRRGASVVVVASAGLAHPGEESQREESFSSKVLGPFMSVPNTTMARGGDMGSGSSMGATMERKPLQFVMPTPTVQGPKLDDGGSGGGTGKHNHNGGGGGDGGDDDDDEFFSGDDDGGEGGNGESRGDGFLRTLIPEAYDKLSIAAVFAEWMRTVTDLPLIIRRAVEMGLFSSAQLVRFFSMDVRPNITRSITRSLPPSWARDFVGRLMADPGFAQKLVLESAFAGSASMYYEFNQRGDKFKKELDLAMINSIGMAAATAATVWLLAPCRSYGSVHKFPWQQMLDNLPNCVFDASGPLRQYSNQARVGSFFAKMAELSAVGAVTGVATSLASSAVVEIHKRSDPSYEPSTSVPSVGRSSGGLATFFATNANIRYQLIGGLDRYLFGHSNFLWTYLGITGLTRLVSISAGELSRPWWQGLPPPGERRMQIRTRRVSKKVQRKVPKLSAAPPMPSTQMDLLSAPVLAGEAAVAVSVAGLASPSLMDAATTTMGTSAAMATSVPELSGQFESSAEPAAPSPVTGYSNGSEQYVVATELSTNAQ